MSASDLPAHSSHESTTTDSASTEELRAELERARERLSYYESFDRIIAENVKRTGEMMTETVALREKAATEARERAQTEETHAAELARYERVITDALHEIAHLRTALDTITSSLAEISKPDTTETEDAPIQVDDLPERSVEPVFAEEMDSDEPISLTDVTPEMHHVTSLEPTTAEEGLVLDPATGVQDAADAPNADPRQNNDEPSDDAEEATASDSTADAPALVDIVAHGAPFNVASDLQMLLRGLDPVTDVQVKQFVNGEMRLVVHATGALPVDDITTWVAGRNGTLTSHRDSVIEVTFG